jgi:hypothetical protein
VLLIVARSLERRPVGSALAQEFSGLARIFSASGARRLFLGSRTPCVAVRSMARSYSENRSHSHSVSRRASYCSVRVAGLTTPSASDRTSISDGHPRGNTDWPLVGIFAQRDKNRPSRLGVSRCRLQRVDGLDLHVTGLDAVAGTPVLDVKPYMIEFGPRGEVHQAAWSTQIMRSYF